jgi:HEAT repeat protein
MKISFSKKIPLDPEKHSELLAQTASEIRTRTASASKEENSELLNVLSFLGSAGNYLIVDLLDNPSRYLRRQALEFLGRKGPEVIPIILAALKQRNGWFFLRNALMILAKIGVRSHEVEALFRHSLQHPELNIKKEAIVGIPVIAKEDGEKLLIPLLQNPDSEVRRRTAVALVSLRSVHPKLLDFLIGSFTDKREGREGDPAQALDLLIELDLPHEAKAKLESILIEMLKGPSILARIRKEALPDNTVKSAAIRTLGSTGTLKSLTVLEKYSSGKDTSLSKAAKEATEKIRQRP